MNDDQTVPKHATPPGHARIKGRLWRTADPSIPGPLHQSLVDELMAARRAVKAARAADARAAERSARRRVQDAKVALGERGPTWWLPRDTVAHVLRIDATIRSLLRCRDAAASLCPSEVARAADAGAWRELMPLVRERAWALAADDVVRVLQGGTPVDARQVRGPIRIARGAKFPDPG